MTQCCIDFQPYAHQQASKGTRIFSQGYDDSESSVRKACVFCLVAVHAVIGDELKPHLSQLTGSKVSRAALS